MGKPTIDDIRATNRAHAGALTWIHTDGADNDIDAGILHRDILLREIDRLVGELADRDKCIAEVLEAMIVNTDTLEKATE